MGWLITVAILFLLAIIPLGINAVYDEDGALVHVTVGPLRFQIVPARSKKKKPKKKTASDQNADGNGKTGKKGKSSSEKSDDADKKKKSGGPIKDFLPLVKVVLKFLNGLRRKLRVNDLELKLILASDDPCKLAVNYGRAWAAVGNLMPQLERVFVIRKRNIEVESDFTADKTKVFARVNLTVTVGRAFVLIVILIGRALVEFIKIFMKRKGGAVNEPKSS